MYTAQLLCFISFSLDYFLSLAVLFLFHRFLGFTVYQYITGFLSWLYKSNLNLVWPILDYSRSEIFNFDSVLHINSIIYIHLRVSCNFLLLYFVLINIKMDKQKMQCRNCKQCFCIVNSGSTTFDWNRLNAMSTEQTF